MANEQKVYRSAVIGCGTIGQAHAKTISAHPRTELVALADVRPEAMQALAGELGLSADSCYLDAAEMLEKESLDIVVVATWAQLHAPMVVAAAQAKVSAIICEKPLALDLADVDKMLAACEASGSKLIVSHQHRFNPTSEKARELIAQGAIGEPKLLTIHAIRGLLNNGSHAVDTARFLLGDPTWEWIIAQVQRDTDRWERGARIEDVTAALIGFSGGISVALGTDLPEPNLGGRLIVGSEGMLRTTREGIRILSAAPSMASKGAGWVDIEVEPGPPSHTAQITELVDWMEGGSGHRNDARQHRHTIELLMGVYESARRRSLVRPPVPVGPSPLQEMIDSGELPVRIPGRVDI